MSLPHKKGLEVRIEFCPSCRQAHLVVTHHGQPVQSVALICITCNMVKREFTATRLRQVADWMEKFDAERPHHPAL